MQPSEHKNLFINRLFNKELNGHLHSHIFALIFRYKPKFHTGIASKMVRIPLFQFRIRENPHQNFSSASTDVEKVASVSFLVIMAHIDVTNRFYMRHVWWHSCLSICCRVESPNIWATVGT